MHAQRLQENGRWSVRTAEARRWNGDRYCEHADGRNRHCEGHCLRAQGRDRKEGSHRSQGGSKEAETVGLYRVALPPVQRYISDTPRGACPADPSSHCGAFMARLIAGVAAILAVTTPLGPLAAQQITAIRAGRLVDVERGEVRRDQILIIRGRRIEAVRSGSDKVPAGALVIDLSRYTVLPGLI